MYDREVRISSMRNIVAGMYGCAIEQKIPYDRRISMLMNTDMYLCFSAAFLKASCHVPKTIFIAIYVM
jgi:hypothetical protein